MDDSTTALRMRLRDELRRQDVYVQFTDDDVWLVDGHFDVDELIAAVIGPALLAERSKQTERDAKIVSEHKDVRYLAPLDDWTAKVGERLAAAIRAQQPDDPVQS